MVAGKTSSSFPMGTSPLFGTVCSHAGATLTSAELATFRKLNSRLQGHPPQKKGCPAFGSPAALWAKVSVWLVVPPKPRSSMAKTAGSTRLHGDGELQEGQIWEAALYAAHHQHRQSHQFCGLEWPANRWRCEGRHEFGRPRRQMAFLWLARASV